MSQINGENINQNEVNTQAILERLSAIGAELLELTALISKPKHTEYPGQLEIDFSDTYPEPSSELIDVNTTEDLMDVDAFGKLPAFKVFDVEDISTTNSSFNAPKDLDADKKADYEKFDELALARAEKVLPITEEIYKKLISNTEVSRLLRDILFTSQDGRRFRMEELRKDSSYITGIYKRSKKAYDEFKSAFPEHCNSIIELLKAEGIDARWYRGSRQRGAWYKLGLNDGLPDIPEPKIKRSSFEKSDVPESNLSTELDGLVLPGLGVRVIPLRENEKDLSFHKPLPDLAHKGLATRRESIREMSEENVKIIEATEFTEKLVHGIGALILAQGNHKAKKGIIAKELAKELEIDEDTAHKLIEQLTSVGLVHKAATIEGMAAISMDSEAKNDKKIADTKRQLESEAKNRAALSEVERSITIKIMDNFVNPNTHANKGKKRAELFNQFGKDLIDENAFKVLIRKMAARDLIWIDIHGRVGGHTGGRRMPLVKIKSQEIKKAWLTKEIRQEIIEKLTLPLPDKNQD